MILQHEYKQKTIKAIQSIIENHKTIIRYQDSIFINFNKCPLCILYKKNLLCIGCPLANEIGSEGCTTFRSFQILKESIGTIYEKYHLQKMNIMFHRILDTIQRYSKERFTPLSWKYFSLIDRNW